MAQELSSGSILQIDHFVFDSLQFQRRGFRQESDEVSIKFNVRVQKTENNHYIVTLILDVDKEDEYTASVSISGYCEIDDDFPQRDLLLQTNAPTILFPYARAQLSLLTAQPETEPLVLPVMNFQQLYETAEKYTSEKDSCPSPIGLTDDQAKKGEGHL